MILNILITKILFNFMYVGKFKTILTAVKTSTNDLNINVKMSNTLCNKFQSHDTPGILSYNTAR